MVIDFYPSILHQVMQFLCQLRICIYQSHKIRIILCSRSFPQLRHDDLECLTNTIITPHALSSSLQTIAERDDIYQEAKRRLRIIEIGRISALTIIPFVMSHRRIMEILPTRNGIQKYISQMRMQSDNGNSSSVNGRYSLLTTDTIAFFPIS